MAHITPFRAIRPREDWAEPFTISAFDSEAKEAAARMNRDNPNTYLRILSPQLFFDDKPSLDECYGMATDKLKEMLDNGIIFQEDQPSIYIYRQVKKNDTYTSIIGLADVDEYRRDKIKKHELTRTEKEDKMARYFNGVRVNGSPVLLTYEDVPAIDEIVREEVETKPLYHFTGDDGVEHMVWRVSDKGMAAIQKAFEQIESLYIADGHHRCASVNTLYPQIRNFMACFIPSSQLRIHGFHRYVKELNGLDKEGLLSALSQYFRIESLGHTVPNIMPSTIQLYIGDEWYTLHIPESMQKHDNPRYNLDVSVLDQIIFNKILKIEDTRTSNNIRYVNGEVTTERLIEPVKRGEVQAVFALAPIRIEEVMEISEYGETMPPKSTWIEPKLRSGILIHRF